MWGKAQSDTGEKSFADVHVALLVHVINELSYCGNFDVNLYSYMPGLPTWICITKQWMK